MNNLNTNFIDAMIESGNKSEDTYNFLRNEYGDDIEINKADELIDKFNKDNIDKFMRFVNFIGFIDHFFKYLMQYITKDNVNLISYFNDKLYSAIPLNKVPIFLQNKSFRLSEYFHFTYSKLERYEKSKLISFYNKFKDTNVNNDKNDELETIIVEKISDNLSWRLCTEYREYYLIYNKQYNEYYSFFQYFGISYNNFTERDFDNDNDIEKNYLIKEIAFAKKFFIPLEKIDVIKYYYSLIKKYDILNEIYEYGNDLTDGVGKYRKFVDNTPLEDDFMTFEYIVHLYALYSRNNKFIADVKNLIN